MPRTKQSGKGKVQAKTGRLKRAVSTVKRALKRGKVAKTAKPAAKAAGPDDTTVRVRVRRKPDIPLAEIEGAYTPTQTSLKGPFRTSGADRQRDQEFATGSSTNDRWKDEDRLTNKSGDPRIGTHGRTYEPGEKRAARGSKKESE